MADFPPALLTAIKKVAAKLKIEPASLCAVVEIESGGKPFEEDNKTPRFLFERHIFYRELSKLQSAKLQNAIDQGLAIPKWSRTTQYKDQGNSKGRQLVLAKARVIDEECANRSCSWGLGQTMGFLCTELGYKSATDMVAELSKGGMQAQVECMVRFIKSKGLTPALKAHDWATFAKGYNGAAYKQNQYDTRLASSYACWFAKLTKGVPDVPEELPLGRTPVQNAEVSSGGALKSPEAIAGYVASGSGLFGSFAGLTGPIAYALAAVIVIAAVIGVFFIIRRMKENPQ